MPDHEPRYVCLHQRNDNGLPRSYILDSWYCWREVGCFTGRTVDLDRTRARAEALSAEWNAEEIDLASAGR